MDGDGLRALGFFALRTPALTVGRFSEWGGRLAAPSASRSELRDALDSDWDALATSLWQAFREPYFSEALFLASPSLWEQVGRAERGGEEQGERESTRLLLAIARYFTRAATRATPFGLFAGTSLGSVGAATDLSIPPLERCRRRTCLDFGLLSDLCEVATRESTHPDLRFRPNSSFTELGSHYRYTEIVRTPNGVRYERFRIDRMPELEWVVRRATRGATRTELIAALVESGLDVEASEARDFVEQLVDASVLVPDLQPTLVGASPERDLLQRMPAGPASSFLAAATRRLENADGELVAGPELYLSLGRQAAEVLPRPRPVENLAVVDLVKPCEHLGLGADVVDEFAAAVEALHAVGPPSTPSSRLQEFARRFVARYGPRWVKLGEALDPDVGIGFSPEGALLADQPLVRDLRLNRSRTGRRLDWSDREELLLALYSTALEEGLREVEVRDTDLAGLRDDRREPLPATFAVHGCVLAADPTALREGAWKISVEGWSGPSATTYLGRYARLDEEWEASILGCHAEEQDGFPEAELAELVHLPPFERRAALLLQRPHSRRYEIELFARSDADASRVLHIDDLWVTVAAEGVVLMSERLGRRILPRLSAPHAFLSARNLAAYTFLASLQRQNVQSEGRWSWFPLSEQKFLPRVRYRRAILAPARWNLTKRCLQRVLQSGDRVELFSAVQTIRRRLGLPRFVRLNRLALDLDNIVSIELLANELRRGADFVLYEFLPLGEGVPVRSKEGAYVHELILPFARRHGRGEGGGDAPKPFERGRVPHRAPRQDQDFVFGSRWLSCKIYVNRTAVDGVLLDPIRPLVGSLVAGGAVRQWFFLRYAGRPNYHMRLRFLLSDGGAAPAVADELRDRLQPAMDEGLVFRLEFDTYQRETERYGGIAGCRLVEDVYCEDSITALELLALLEETRALHRWEASFLSLHRLLDDLGLAPRERLGIVSRLSARFYSDFHLDGPGRRQLAAKLRELRPRLTQLLRSEVPAIRRPLGAILDRRSAAVNPLAAGMREHVDTGRIGVPFDSLVASICHMSLNRLLPVAPREHELVLYDFLRKMYESQAARAAALRA